jgi:flagellar hook-associated protein 2
LGLDGEAETMVVDGVTTQAINGAGTFTQSAALNGLAALAAKINSFKAGVTASTVFDGTGYRLLLSVDESGAGRELLVDGADVGLSFEQLNPARDAVIEFGGAAAGSGLLVASSDNTFDELLPGVELTVVAPSENNVTIRVAQDQAKIITSVEDFVDAFNSIRENLDEVTSFNEEDLTTGILFGTTAVLRVESDLNRILSGRFFGVGAITSLEAIGLSFGDKGKINLDRGKLDKILAKNPGALEQFFTHKSLGLSAKLQAAIKQLAGEKDSVLASRAETLKEIIANFRDRVTFMDERLARERERLLAEFARIESTIAAMQQNLTALANLQIIPPLTSTLSNRSLFQSS